MSDNVDPPNDAPPSFANLSDGEIEQILGQLIDPADSPRRLAALDIFHWSRIDAELAVLIADSRGTADLVAVPTRAMPEASAFQLTFSFSGHSVTVDVEVTSPDESTIVVLLDAATGISEVSISLADSTLIAQPARGHGVVVRGVRRPGPIRLIVGKEGTTIAVSPWFSI